MKVRPLNNRTPHKGLVAFRELIVSDVKRIALTIGLTITYREEEVLGLRATGMTMGEVAKELGISACRVRQLEFRAYQKYLAAVGMSHVLQG